LLLEDLDLCLLFRFHALKIAQPQRKTSFFCEFFFFFSAFFS